MDVLRALKQGEPPANQDIMQSVRLLGDLPAGERPQVSVLTGTSLSTYIKKVRHQKAADFSVCDVLVPFKIE